MAVHTHPQPLRLQVPNTPAGLVPSDFPISLRLRENGMLSHSDLHFLIWESWNIFLCLDMCVFIIPSFVFFAGSVHVCVKSPYCYSLRDLNQPMCWMLCWFVIQAVYFQLIRFCLSPRLSLGATPFLMAFWGGHRDREIGMRWEKRGKCSNAFLPSFHRWGLRSWT